MRIMVFFIAIFCCTQTAYAQNWKKIEDFPAAERDDGASFVIGEKAYAGSGVVPFTPLRDFYAFDFKSESWSSIQELPIYKGRQYSAAFASSKYGFVFGGISNQFLNDLWRYDPSVDQWQEMSALNADGRGGSAAFVIDSFAYIIGGKTQTKQALSEVWAYNMFTDIWVRKADLPFGSRWRSAATTYKNKGYLVFGLDDTSRYSPEIYEYDPSTDQWNLFSVFPQGGRNYVKAHTINNSLITVAGQDSSGAFLNECWKLDYLTKTWESTISLPALGRRGGISFNDQSSIYYTTGLGDSGRRFVETWKFENPTSINEIQIIDDVNIYPNPANNRLNVWMSIASGEYELIDLKGKQVMHGTFNTDQLIISVQGLEAGFYFLSLRSKNLRIIKKITIY